MELSFPEAFYQLLAGKSVTRKPWKGYVKMFQAPEESVAGVLNLPYLVRFDVVHTEMAGDMGAVLPWTPSQFDLFAKDWIVIK